MSFLVVCCYTAEQAKHFFFIILASSHHIFTGPAEDIYEEDYYKNMKKALKPNGVLCSQGSNNLTFSYFITISRNITISKFQSEAKS